MKKRRYLRCGRYYTRWSNAHLSKTNKNVSWKERRTYRMLGQFIII